MPGAAQRDRDALFPRDAFAAMADLGLMGMLVPPEFGGMGADHVSYVLAIIEIAAADGAASTALQVHNGLNCMAVLKYGSAEQKYRLLRPLAEGKLLGAFCLTEPGAGSDASAITTRAGREGDKFVLNGVKHFITSGSNADVVVVFAVTNPDAQKNRISAFIVPTSTPGYVVTRVQHTMGQRSGDHCQIAFENCEVSLDQLLGNEGQGLQVAFASLELGRLGVAAQSIGMARAAFDAALVYAKQRRTPHYRTPGRGLSDRGYGDVASSRRVDGAACRSPARRQPPIVEGKFDGEAIRGRYGRAGLQQRHPNPRRLRLPR
jgi:butyryl-CoA dehydrogenase